MDISLKDKVAIITGASLGIGKGIAKSFSEHGAKVVICARGVDRLNEVAEEIRKSSDNEVWAIPCDVSKKSDIDDLVDKVVKKYSRIDILVNNAAIQEYAPFLEMSEDFWDSHFDINVKGMFLFSQAVIRVMLGQGGGRIINLSSDSGVAALPAQATAYCSTKSAIIGLTRCIAKEFGRDGIYCNAICPGCIVDTGGYTNYAETDGVGKGRLQADTDNTAIGRLGYSSDIADVALFFASEMSNFITGEHLLATGGDTMAQ